MIVSISAKCGDLFILSFGGFEYRDYVPKGMGIGGGDYIKLDIDLKTGKIIGWNADEVQQVIEDLRD